MTPGQGIASALPASLAYSGEDGHVYVLRSSHDTPERVTWNAKGLCYGVWQPMDAIDRIRFLWPTWSPAGDKLACLGTYGHGGQELGTGVYAIDLERGIESWEIVADVENAPTYFNWAPDGRRIAVVMKHSDTLRLTLADIAFPGETTELMSGEPLYHGFSPDGRFVAILLGGRFNGQPGRRLYLVDLRCPGSRLTLSNRPGLFGTPSWSPDGRFLAYTIENHEGQHIYLSEDALGDPLKLGSFSGIGAMLWSNDSRRLLVATGPGNPPGQFTQLWSFPVDGQDPERILQERLTTFYCAQGGRLLYLSAGQTAHSYTWKIRSQSGDTRVLAKLYPSQSQEYLMQQFHQYHQSHRLLSPDGTTLVFSGYSSREEMEDDATSPQVFLCSLNGDAYPRSLAKGSLACWAPARSSSVTASSKRGT